MFLLSVCSVTTVSINKLRSGPGIQNCSHVCPTFPHSFKHNTVVIYSSFRAVISPVLCLMWTIYQPERRRRRSERRWEWRSGEGSLGAHGQPIQLLETEQQGACCHTCKIRLHFPKTLQTPAAVPHPQGIIQKINKLEKGIGRWQMFYRCLFMLFCFGFFLPFRA